MATVGIETIKGQVTQSGKKKPYNLLYLLHFSADECANELAASKESSVDFEQSNRAGNWQTSLGGLFLYRGKEKVLA